MNKDKARGWLVALGLGVSGLVAISLISGCSVFPTQRNTYEAVDKYFHIGATPYSVIFPDWVMWGNIKAWPMEIYPLDHRGKFERAYPGKYYVFQDESGNWIVADEMMMKALAAESLTPFRGR